MFILNCSSNKDMAWQLYTTSPLDSAELVPIFPRWCWIKWGKFIVQTRNSRGKVMWGCFFWASPTSFSHGTTKLHQDLCLSVLFFITIRKHLLWSICVSVSASPTAGKSGGTWTGLPDFEYVSVWWGELPTNAETFPSITQDAVPNGGYKKTCWALLIAAPRPLCSCYGMQRL